MSENYDFWEHMEKLDDMNIKKDEEFRRLCADPSSKVPEKGDRVIVATGFLAMGPLWAREECEVMEVGETSIKVRFLEYQPFGGEKGSLVKWIHPALVTDVLKK